jgi:hypothetical protein
MSRSKKLPTPPASASLSATHKHSPTLPYAQPFFGFRADFLRWSQIVVVMVAASSPATGARSQHHRSVVATNLKKVLTTISGMG